jgi:small subunit ribosomal protein S18
VCQFCVDKIKIVDYKDLSRLRRFLSERGKIEPRRKTGTCAAHQRSLNVALKNARLLALLPFTAEHIRITGVPAREPGSAMRGPRPPRFTEAGEGEPEVTENGAAPAAEAPTEAAAEAPAEGGPPPSTDSPETVAEAPAAQQGTSPETVAAAPAAQGTSDTPATGPTQPEA